MDSVFEGKEVVATDMTEDDAQKKAEKKAQAEKMRKLFEADMQKDPTLKERIRTRSDELKVLNTLGYGVEGNVVVDKAAQKAAGDGSRPMVPASRNVGYKVQNVGTEPIEYETEIWEKGEDGLYHGTRVSKTMAPGEIVDLAKEYLARLTSRDEFGFRLQNGSMKHSSKTKSSIKTLKDILNAFYFIFSKDESGNVVNVNDDDVKIAIDVDGVVTPEYEAVFGFLNNPKTSGRSKGSKAGSKGSGITSQDIFAHYINNLIKEQDTV